MKHIPTVAGAILGLMFIAFSSMVLFNLVEVPPPPNDDSALSHFMRAFQPTGYMTFVKVCELIGGILVAIPLTRNLGLLVLGPIIVNIIAFHVLIQGPLLNPILIAIVALTLFLLWVERRAFLGLIHRSRA